MTTGVHPAGTVAPTALIRPGIRYSQLTGLGFTPSVAYGLISRELSVARNRRVIEEMSGYDDGRAALARAAHEWHQRGFPPPWTVDPLP